MTLAADEPLDLGPCCACEVTGPAVRNILMLDKKSPIPGHGWGCLVCGLPSDGASAVVCDRCLATNAQLRFACRGYPGIDGRIPFAELAGSHTHDMDQHADDRSGGLPAIPSATPWQRL